MGLASGCIVPFFRAAFRSTVPITVPLESFAAAQSIVQGVSAVAELTAFAAAGWLVHVFGGPAGLAIDAASFLWAASVTPFLRRTPPALHKGDRTDVLTELGDGARYVRRHPVLRPIALSELIAGIGTGILGSVVIVHVTKTLGYDTGPQGIVYAIGGVGSLVAAAFAARVLARYGLHHSIFVALIAVVPAISLMAFAPRPSVLGYAMLVGQQLIADPVGTVSSVAFGTVIAAGSARCHASARRVDDHRAGDDGHGMWLRDWRGLGPVANRHPGHVAPRRSGDRSGSVVPDRSSRTWRSWCGRCRDHSVIVESGCLADGEFP